MTIKLDKNEFYAKYGDVKVKFSGYYKYVFTYDAVLPNRLRLVVWYGGDSGEIYKHDVTANEYRSVRSLCPYAGYIYDGEEIVEEFDE
jgi:hypothetical protein